MKAADAEDAEWLHLGSASKGAFADGEHTRGSGAGEGWLPGVEGLMKRSSIWTIVMVAQLCNFTKSRIVNTVGKFYIKCTPE